MRTKYSVFIVGLKSGVCFTKVSWALQNSPSKFAYCRNHIHGKNFKPKLCMCAQAMFWVQVSTLHCNVVNGTPVNKFSEISIKIQEFSYKKIHLKMLSGKCCLCLNALTTTKYILLLTYLLYSTWGRLSDPMADLYLLCPQIWLILYNECWQTSWSAGT